MIKIRLARYGVKRKPFYRIIAVNEREKGAGMPLEILGYWHPAKSVKKIDTDKIESWVKKGAKLTKAVDNLMYKDKK